MLFVQKINSFSLNTYSQSNPKNPTICFNSADKAIENISDKLNHIESIEFDNENATLSSKIAFLWSNSINSFNDRDMPG